MVDLESSGKETLSLLPSLASVAAPQTWEKALSRADLNSFYYSVTDCLYPQLKTHIWKQASLAAWMGRLAHLFSWILGWEYTTVPMVSLLHKVRTKYSSARAYGFIRVHHPKGQSSSSKRPWHRLTDLKSCELQVMLRTGWQETKQIHQLPYILFLRSLMLWWLKKNKHTPPPPNKQTNHSPYQNPPHWYRSWCVGEGFLTVWYSSRSCSKLLTEVWSSGYIWGHLALKEELKLLCLVLELK